MKRALEGFTEVTEVAFIPHRELFGVEYTSERPKGAEFREAVLDVVIAPGVRKMLGEIGDRKMDGAPAGDTVVETGNSAVSAENNVVH